MMEISQVSLLDAMEVARREEIEREARRRELMATIARHRWQIARNHHRLETGEALDFSRYPFQQAIYEDDAPEMVLMGSTQWGKSELLVCTAAAMAACGLRVFYVISKYDKCDKFVASTMSERIDLPLGCMGVQPKSVRGPAGVWWKARLAILNSATSTVAWCWRRNHPTTAA